MRILILGSTGLLGNAVTKHFISNDRYAVTTTYRDKSISFPGSSVRFDALSDAVETLPAGFDYVINCIGIIKPFMANDHTAAIYINSLLPWRLAQWCRTNGQRLLHITTDCVYSGKQGKYKESDPHDALDAYGKSKSLGECSTDAMVLRTSIIGQEIHKNASLLAWAKSQRGKSVEGYQTHLWNGVTTGKYAEICERIMRDNLYEEGLFHIFAKDDVSKARLLHYFNENFNLNMIIQDSFPEKIDRTLRTEKELCKKLEIPTVHEMVMEMV